MEFDKRAMELQVWIAGNANDWMKICGVGEPVSRDEFYRLRHKLKTDGFPELFHVLLTCNYDVVNRDAAQGVELLIRQTKREQEKRAQNQLSNKQDNEKTHK